MARMHENGGCPRLNLAELAYVGVWMICIGELEERRATTRQCEPRTVDYLWSLGKQRSNGTSLEQSERRGASRQ